MDEYVRHIKWAKLKVGIVITIALIVFFIAVMFSGNIEDMFNPQARIYAEFNDVRGLRPGAPVWFAGIEIGRINSMSFYTEGKIRVLMLINRDALKYLKRDSSARILTLGLLGDKYLELCPGSAHAANLIEGDTLTGSTQLEFQDIMVTSREAISRVSELVKKLDGFIMTVEKGKGTFSQLLTDRILYDNLKDTTRHLSNVLKKVEEGEGTLGKLVSDKTIYLQLESSAKSIKEFADNLKKTDSTINLLVKDRELYDKFLSASVSLDEFTKKIKSGKGFLGKLAEDESMYENLSSASEKLNRLLEKLEHGEGVFGELIQKGDLHRDLTSTVKELNALITDMKENPKKYFEFSLF